MAAYAEEKKRGTRPIAGFTCSEMMPEISRMRKAGGKVAREIARRAWGVDLEKIVRLSMV